MQLYTIIIVFNHLNVEKELSANKVDTGSVARMNLREGAVIEPLKPHSVNELSIDTIVNNSS